MKLNYSKLTPAQQQLVAIAHKLGSVHGNMNTIAALAGKGWVIYDEGRYWLTAEGMNAYGEHLEKPIVSAMLYLPRERRTIFFAAKALMDDIEFWADGLVISRRRRLNYWIFMAVYGDELEQAAIAQEDEDDRQWILAMQPQLQADNAAFPIGGEEF